MRSISGKEFARVLERKGWRLARVKGSHHIYVRDDSPTRISVPIHGSRSLKKGLQRHLMKVANLEDHDL